MYVAQRMSAMVPPTLSLSQLGRRVKDARYAAGVVQRLYQVHFWQVDNNNPDSDLRKQALALQRDFWELKKEYETFEQHGDPKELASRPAARLATNFAKLCADVGRVKWYEEDAHSNAQRVRQLELELSAAKQKIEDLEVRHAQRTAELLAEIERNESKYQEACGDNIQLYDETVALIKENEELKKVRRHSQSVEFLRGRLKEYMDCAARDSMQPRTQVLLLADGDDAKRAKAVRVLTIHAKRTPLAIMKTDGAVCALFQVVADDPDQAAAAAAALVLLAEHDSVGFFERVANLGRLLLDLCRDDDVRKAARAPLARLVRLLTTRSGGGVLDTKPKQIEFCSAVLVLWPKTEAERSDPATIELLGAMANLARMDHTLFAHNVRTVERLLPFLCTPEPSAEVLVVVRLLAQAEPMRQLFIEREDVLASILWAMRSRKEEDRPIRVEAARLLAALAEGDEAARDAVVQADPFCSLVAMAKSSEQDEYEQAMRTARCLLSDLEFCLTAMRDEEFVLLLVYHIIESETAFATLATLLERSNDAFSEVRDPEAGYVARCEFLSFVLSTDSKLKDIVNHHLFNPSSQKRRLDAIKIAGVLATVRDPAALVADYHMPGIESCLRSARTIDERNWAVHAVAQVYANAGALAVIRFPGMLAHLVGMVEQRVEVAGRLLALMMQNAECAHEFGRDRKLRHRLFLILTRSESDAMRDRAAMALAEVYEHNAFLEDHDFVRVKQVKRALEQLRDFRSPLMGDGANGASRLAKHVDARQKSNG